MLLYVQIRPLGSENAQSTDNINLVGIRAIPTIGSPPYNWIPPFGPDPPTYVFFLKNPKKTKNFENF